MQIAEIVAHIAKETVDGTATVNPFRGCPNSRPTNIIRWWRGKHPNLLTMAHAKTIGERAAREFCATTVTSSMREKNDDCATIAR